MDSMLSSQSMEVSGAAVNVLALRLQESSQTTQFSIDQIPQSSQQITIHFSDEFCLRAFGYTEALGHDGSDSSHFGLTLHLMHAIPLNKKLYTFSYVCLTSGAALVFSAVYALLPWRDKATEIQNTLYNLSILGNNSTDCWAETDAALRSKFLNVKLCPEQVDIWDLKYMFLPLEQIGMNAMLVYLMVGIFVGFTGGWYDDDPHNALTFPMEVSDLTAIGAMIQQPRIPSSGLMPASDAVTNRDTLIELLAKHTENSEKTIRTAMRRPFYMDGTTAKEFGVIDKILWRGQESIVADVGAPEEWEKKAGIKSVDGF
ncbi:hypothetical protein Q3G72_020369 [Acer saccharum]|nr:hypothetical protein Q3G72_020369 [Acer saccharum]